MSVKQIFSLCFKADFVGCYALQLYKGFDHPDHEFTIKLRCENCMSNVKVVKMKLREVQAMLDGLATECDNCHAWSFTKMMAGFGGPHLPGGLPGVPNGFSEMMRFEIDGAIPERYLFGPNWEVTYHGKIFRNIDLIDHFEPINIWTAMYDEIDEEEARINPAPAIEPYYITISEPVAKFFKKEDIFRD